MAAKETAVEKRVKSSGLEIYIYNTITPSFLYEES